MADSEERGHQVLREHGALPFCRRLIILHCSKLVGLAVFAAAMQGQDAIGWLFVGNLPLPRKREDPLSPYTAIIQSVFKYDTSVGKRMKPLY